MLTFREQVAADFKNVLLNVEEYGRICSWNGVPLQIVESAAPPLIEATNAPGTLLATKEIICRIEDMPVEPVTGQNVNLDGETWYVIDVKKPFGHYMIPLGRYQS